MYRSAKMASITIVDEVSRVAKCMLNYLSSDEEIDIDIDFNNQNNLQQSINIIASNYIN